MLGKDRTGATLTEVLIALMIMSIGIVSLAAMFPLSVLRAIKASQLTNATDLRYNAEALLALFPDAIANPDQDYLTTGGKNVAEHEPPLGIPPAGTPNVSRWVIDPIGWYAIAALNLGNAQEDYFGVDATGNPVAVNRAIPRYHLGFTSPAAAGNFQSLPDSWSIVHDGAVLNPSTTQTGVAGLSDASGLVDPVSGMLPVGITYRATIFDVNGQGAHFRTLTSAQVTPTSGIIFWTEDLDNDGALDPGEDFNGNGRLDTHPLPITFTPGTVRIESQEARYTWMMTVRRQPSTALPDAVADVDMVVYFRRSFDDVTDDERLWPVGPPAAPGNVNGFTVGRNQIRVDFGAGGQPNLKKGGYCFDGDNGYWYRVRDFTIAGTQAFVTLETSARASSPAAGGFAMFPRNVVDVYPIGQKVVTP